MAGLTRRERERLRHRGEVLEAAEELFSVRGFHDTTVQDIAEKSEFAVGSLYNMFESKDALYYEIVRVRAREFMEKVKNELEAMGTPERRIQRLLRAKFEFFRIHRQFFTIFSRVLSDNPVDCPAAFTDDGRELHSEYMDILKGIFREGIEAGRFADLDPALLALSFEGITRILISNYLFQSGAEPSGSDWDSIERVIFRGVLSEER